MLFSLPNVSLALLTINISFKRGLGCRMRGTFGMLAVFSFLFFLMACAISPTRDPTQFPLQWKHGALTTGPLGKSLFYFFKHFLKFISLFLFLAASGLSFSTWDSFVVHRLSCSVACGILDPQPGVEPASPALEGGFFTTEAPGKSLVFTCWLCYLSDVYENSQTVA